MTMLLPFICIYYLNVILSSCIFQFSQRCSVEGSTERIHGCTVLTPRLSLHVRSKRRAIWQSGFQLNCVYFLIIIIQNDTTYYVPLSTAITIPSRFTCTGENPRVVWLFSRTGGQTME